MGIFRRKRRRRDSTSREIAAEFSEPAVTEYVVPGVFRTLRAVVSGLFRALD
ncbi:hypothetical protein OHA40_25405 [Nocardia sp. NBC_00508]|uniref:hypothetical protein n=1 Tax=Nocardia sp. NBC_00508 TaxID=2975992 RepID=UPI002E8027E2|nr:hypothetical protein [Nocardia sp. NBC_00508]WUD64978.1 hypothetical protein OHA40_25405 [Nocardia sp. NBC_00508]